MKEVIAIISRKGGTGKTTSADSLAAALQKKGYKTLLIDLDAQRNLTAATGAKFTGPNITDVLTGSVTAEEATQQTQNGDIITGSPFLAAADLVITSDKELKEAIQLVLKNYDYVLIDTPANYGKLTRNALTVATSAIITQEAATFSADGLKEAAAIIDQIKPINPALKLRGILITKYAGRSNIVKQILEEMRTTAEQLNTVVLDPPIRATDKIIDAQAVHKNIVSYAPRNAAAQCYLAIADIIEQW